MHVKNIEQLNNQLRHNNECISDNESQINSLLKEIKNEKNIIEEENNRHKQILEEYQFDDKYISNKKK